MHAGTKSRTISLVIAVGLLAAACAPPRDQPPAGSQQAQGGEFSVYVCEPEHLVPQNTNETCGAEVLNALFTGLVDYDPQSAQPVNAVAESIESEDQRVWTIQIADGWTFHDGSPVTAQSFIDAWNWGAYAPNAAGNAHFFEKIEGYEALQCPEGQELEEGGCRVEPPVTEMTGLTLHDDRTFEVTLNAPFSQFPLTVGYTAFYPLPRVFFDDPEAFEESPVGNGPFQMDGSWEHNQRIRVTRYDDYAGDPAEAQAVEFRIYSEIDTAYNDLLAGNLDVMDDIPSAQIERAKQEFGDNFIEDESSSFTYIGFPLYQSEFQNKDLRQAFSMAIDRQAITEAIRTDSVPATGLVGPVVAGSREDACGQLCEYNPERARQLFDQAGGWEGTLTLWFNSGADHDQWMQAVANQLRTNLGIEDIRFETLEFAEYLEKLDQETVTGPFRLGWVMDYPSPQNYLEPIYSTTGSSNNFTYSNPEVDQLIERGNAAGSIEDGIDFYHQAEDLILEDMPNIPMFFGRVTGAHSDRVDNVIVDAFTRINVADIEVVQP
ncbi:MAG TPA: ABC transporter substrate-binding protein [Egibacteraceae bacterium]|nr:ABC transporter substrate-binding protein [Actinomycetota bacterium]HWB73104.1 ABC transporter substrate-binding protein [Egibacteraceae bacterium]